MSGGLDAHSSELNPPQAPLIIIPRIEPTFSSFSGYFLHLSPIPLVSGDSHCLFASSLVFKYQPTFSRDLNPVRSYYCCAALSSSWYSFRFAGSNCRKAILNVSFGALGIDLGFR